MTGLGSAEAACFRDIFKVAKSFINDRVPAVRLAAVQVCVYAYFYQFYFNIVP